MAETWVRDARAGRRLGDDAGPLGLERLEALAPALLQDAHEVDDMVRLGDRVRDRVPVAQVGLDG